MTQNIRDFIGMKKGEMTRADELLDNLLITAFSGFEKHFDIQWQQYNRLNDFLAEFSRMYPNKEYVVEWFHVKGIAQLQQLGTALYIVVDIEAFLEYEQFLLETDLAEGSAQDFLYSITEIIPAITTYVDEFYEEALNSSLHQQEQIEMFSSLLQSGTQGFTEKLNWSIEIPEGSAIREEAGLLLAI